MLSIGPQTMGPQHSSSARRAALRQVPFRIALRTVLYIGINGLKDDLVDVSISFGYGEGFVWLPESFIWLLLLRFPAIQRHCFVLASATAMIFSEPRRVAGCDFLYWQPNLTCTTLPLRKLWSARQVP